MARAPLPDPTWTEAAEICIGCGYSLKGLPVPGRCPECGAHYEARQLILAGIPRSLSGTSTPRRAAWIAVFITGGLLSQTWMFFLAPRLWYIPIVILGSLILAVGFLLATGQRERHASERFCLTPSGLARVAATYDPASTRLDSDFLPWAECDAFELKRISPVWRRLRIGRKGPKGHLMTIRFDAGFRCPDASADIILSTLNQYLRPGTPPTHPPTAPPPLTGRV